MTEPAASGFEKIASGIYIEGLAVDYRRDIIWYSDVIKGGIHGVRPDGTKVTSFNEDRMWTGGVYMNEDGSVDLYSPNTRRRAALVSTRRLSARVMPT